MDKVNITFDSDNLFNFAHGVIMYYISATSLPGDDYSNITCPSSCHPNELCVCTGSLARSGVNMTISAVNCKDQEGPPLVIKIKSILIKIVTNYIYIYI